MKKGLLLSVVASTMIFAGGDIVPVEPAVVAPAADCSDFSGHVGAYYNTFDADTNVDVTDGDLFGKNASKLEVAASIHVEKDIAYGIGFGATAGGRIAIAEDGTFTKGTNQGSLQELYLTATFGNTAAKVGRFALPGSLAPLTSSDDTNGVYDNTYQGLLVANTDIENTTVYGVAVTALVKDDKENELKTAKDGDNNALLALGVVNTSLEGVKLTAVGYYLGSYALDTNGDEIDATAGVLTVNTRIANYGVDAQVAYLDNGADSADATIAAALKVSAKYDMFNAWAQVEYINDGDAALNLFGDHESLMADAGQDMTAVKAGIKNLELGMGKLYASAEYRMSNADNSDWTKTIATVGYDFKVSGVNFNAEYEYTTTDSGLSGADTVDSSELSLKAVYKF